MLKETHCIICEFRVKQQCCAVKHKNLVYWLLVKVTVPDREVCVLKDFVVRGDLVHKADLEILLHKSQLVSGAY